MNIVTYIFLGRPCTQEEVTFINDAIVDGDDLSWSNKNPLKMDGFSVFKYLFTDGCEYEYYVVQQAIGVLDDNQSDLVFDITKFDKPHDTRYKLYFLQEMSV
jgi:hypothetical protein